MELVIDPDLKSVAEFMQEQLPANRLVAVANGLAGIAPLLWGQYQSEEVETLRLVSPPISSDRPVSTQASSSE
jgi:hypothetical protein